MGKVDIDVLEPKKSLIDLEGNSSGDFGLTDEYILSFIFDDIILVEKLIADGIIREPCLKPDFLTRGTHE